ncbi:MAG: chitobiase/beta-hexosaminidase C-terminal domain-containing protein [Lachnospiraceae bacterium]|nr:chitobiase/beta-hexosaminidase C-terminal domain-containing protein [Lachnospiraceae bacterium]
MKRRRYGKKVLAVLLMAVMMLEMTEPVMAGMKSAEFSGEEFSLASDGGTELVPEAVEELMVEEPEPRDPEGPVEASAGDAFGEGKEEPELPDMGVNYPVSAMNDGDLIFYEFDTPDNWQNNPVSGNVLDLSKKYIAIGSYPYNKQNGMICIGAMPVSSESDIPGSDMVPVVESDEYGKPGTPYPDGLVHLYLGSSGWEDNAKILYYSNRANAGEDGFSLAYMHGNTYYDGKGELRSEVFLLPGQYRFLIYNDDKIYYSGIYEVIDPEGVSSVLGTVDAKLYDVKNPDGSYGVRDASLKGGRDSLTYLSSRSKLFYLDLSGFEKQIGRKLGNNDRVSLIDGSQAGGGHAIWGTSMGIWPLNNLRADDAYKYPHQKEDLEHNRIALEEIQLKTAGQGSKGGGFLQDGHSYRLAVILNSYDQSNQVYLDNKTYQFVDQADGIRIKTTVLPKGHKGEAYTARIEAEPVNKGAEVTWDIIQNKDGTESQLPPGVAKDDSKTGILTLSGILPEADPAQSYRFTLKASEAGGKETRREFIFWYSSEVRFIVSGLDEGEEASLYYKDQNGGNAVYIGSVQNGGNYCDISQGGFTTKDKTFYLCRALASGAIEDAETEIHEDKKTVTMKEASKIQAYSVSVRSTEGTDLSGSVNPALFVSKGDGQRQYFFQDPGNRIRLAENTDTEGLKAFVTCTSTSIWEGYQLEADDGIFTPEIDAASQTITIQIKPRKQNLALSGRVYARKEGEEIPVPGAVVTIVQTLPNGDSLTRAAVSRTSGNEAGGSDAVYRAEGLLEGLPTTLVVYGGDYGKKSLYRKTDGNFSSIDEEGAQRSFDFPAVSQSSAGIDIGEYVGKSIVTLLLEGASEVLSVSGDVIGTGDRSAAMDGYSYSIADFLEPDVYYAGKRALNIRRLGSVSVNVSEDKINALFLLSKEEQSSYGGKKYEAYELSLPGEVREDDALIIKGLPGDQEVKVVSPNGAGKYAIRRISGYGFLDLSKVESAGRMLTGIYTPAGVKVRPFTQTGKQALLPEGAYKLILYPDTCFLPDNVEEISADQALVRDIQIESGKVCPVEGKVPAPESGTYAYLKAPECAGAGEVYEIRGTLHPSKEGVQELYLRANGLQQVIVDGKTLKGETNPHDEYSMIYRGLNLRKEASVRMRIRMPADSEMNEDGNTVLFSAMEYGGDSYRLLSELKTKRKGSITLVLPARADMDVDTGKAEIAFHGKAKPDSTVYIYDNGIPAGFAAADYSGNYSGTLSLMSGGLFHTIRASRIFVENNEDFFDPEAVERHIFCEAGQAILSDIVMNFESRNNYFSLNGLVHMIPGETPKKYMPVGNMKAVYEACLKNVSVYDIKDDQAIKKKAGQGNLENVFLSGLKKIRQIADGDIVYKYPVDSYDLKTHEIKAGTEGYAFFRINTVNGIRIVPAVSYRIDGEDTVTLISGRIDQGPDYTTGVSLVYEPGAEEGYDGGTYFNPTMFERDENGKLVWDEDGYSYDPEQTTKYDHLVMKNTSPYIISSDEIGDFQELRYGDTVQNGLILEKEGGAIIGVSANEAAMEKLKALNNAGLLDGSVSINRLEPGGAYAAGDSIEAVGDGDTGMDLTQKISYEEFMDWDPGEDFVLAGEPETKPATLQGIIEERNRQLLRNMFLMKAAISEDSALREDVTKFGRIEAENARKTSNKDYSLVAYVDYASALDEKMMDKMGYRQSTYDYETEDEKGGKETLKMRIYTATTFYKKNGEIIADPSKQNYDSADAALDTYIFYNPEVEKAEKDPVITADLHPFKWTRIQIASMVPGANSPIYVHGFVAPLPTWTPGKYDASNPLGIIEDTGERQASIASNGIEPVGATKFKPVENTKVGFFGTGFKFDINPKNYSESTWISGAGLALGYFNMFRSAALNRVQKKYSVPGLGKNAKDAKLYEQITFMDGKGSYSMADDTLRIGKIEKFGGKWTMHEPKWFGNETYKVVAKQDIKEVYTTLMRANVSELIGDASLGFTAIGMFKSYTADNPPTTKMLMNDTRQQLTDAMRWVSQNKDLEKEIGTEARQTLMECIVDRMTQLTEVEKNAECADHQAEFSSGDFKKALDGISFVTGIFPFPVCEGISLTTGTLSFLLDAANDNATKNSLKAVIDYGQKHDAFMMILAAYGYPPKKDEEKKEGGGGGEVGPDDPEDPLPIPPPPGPIPGFTPYNAGEEQPQVESIPVQDPSGVVYEAVLSNPLEGAAVRLYSGNAETADGRPWKPEYSIDASSKMAVYYQDGRPVTPNNTASINNTVSKNVPDPNLILPESPAMITGPDGRFRWDVAEGLWYVEAEKPGYNLDGEGKAKPSDSQGDIASTVTENEIKWMPVLPAQLDVNLPMVDRTAPFIIDDPEDRDNIDNVRAQVDGIIITFSKYMDERSLGVSEDKVVIPGGEADRRTVRSAMPDTHYEVYDASGEEIPCTLVLLDSERAPANRTYGGEAPWYTSRIKLSFNEIREDRAGEEVSVRLISGTENFKSYAGTAMSRDYTGTKTTLPVIHTEEPVFSPPSGTIFDKEDEKEITITCATEGAVIYYTLDGTEPLNGMLVSDTAARYDQPVVITKDTTIKAVARRIGYFDSGIVTASYTLKTDEGGKDEGDDEEPKADDFWLTGFHKKLFFTGKKQTQPDIVLHYGDVCLKAGRDYRVSYADNLKAGMARMIFKGMGNYDMTLEYPFEILPVNISANSFEAPDLCVRKPKSGNAKRPKVVLKWNDKALKIGANRDYIMDDSKVDYGKAGTYAILLKGVNNFTGEYPLEYIITENVPISGVKISALKAQEWTGNPIELKAGGTGTVSAGEFVVRYKGKVITKGFTVSFRNNTDAGTARLLLKGTGEDCGDGRGTKLAGTKAVSFKIKGRPMKKVKVTGLPANAVYNGRAQMPAAELVYNGTMLKEGTDYTVSYRKNINAGRASVLFKGKGGYAGTLKKTFVIGKLAFSDTLPSLTVSVGDAPYAKGGAKSAVKLCLSGNELEEGRDYTLKYENNKEAGLTGKVTIRGKKNFTGSIQREFTIRKQTLSCLNLTAPDVVYRNRNGNYKTKPVLYDLNGKRLAAGTDYEKTVSYRKSTASGNEGTEPGDQEILEAGTWLIVVLTAKGSNYTGQVSKAYRVVSKSIGKARFVIPEQVYVPGGAAELTEDDIGKIVSTPSGIKTEVVPGSYRNNKRAGRASVVLHGLGDYGCTKTVTFRIRRRNKKGS